MVLAKGDPECRNCSGTGIAVGGRDCWSCAPRQALEFVKDELRSAFEVRDEELDEKASNLNTAKAAAIAELGAVEKASKNDFHGYAYASAEDIISACRGPMSKHGLSLIPLASTIGVIEGTDIVALKLSYSLGHSSGESERLGPFEIPFEKGKGRPWDKAAFGARTEGYAYALRDVFCIPRVDADVSSREDKEETGHHGGRSKPKPKPAPKQAPKGGATPGDFWKAALKDAGLKRPEAVKLLQDMFGAETIKVTKSGVDLSALSSDEIASAIKEVGHAQR